jgi:chromatin remodeling complex protein RSC6
MNRYRQSQEDNDNKATDAEVGKYYEVTERLQTRNYFGSLSSFHYGCQMITFGQISPQDRDSLRRKIKAELPPLEKELEEKKHEEKENEKKKEERRLFKYAQKQQEEAKKRLEHEERIPRYRVSDELARFLGKPPGLKITQKEVLLEIQEYIGKNKLLKGNFEKVIVLDSKLASLLNFKRHYELSHKRLSDVLRMSPHFAEERKAKNKEREKKEFEERFKKEEKEKRYQTPLV